MIISRACLRAAARRRSALRLTTPSAASAAPLSNRAPPARRSSGGPALLSHPRCCSLLIHPNPLSCFVLAHPSVGSDIRGGGSRRWLSASLSEDDLRCRLDEFQDLFVEARLSIEDCADSADTTYFDEEADCAKEAVEEAVQCFEALLGELDEDTKGRVVRQNGLKVEQLKGELELVLKGGHAH